MDKISNSDISALVDIFESEMRIRGVGHQSTVLILERGVRRVADELAQGDRVVGIHYQANMLLNPIESLVMLDESTGIVRLHKPVSEDSFLSGEFEYKDMFLVLRNSAVDQSETIRAKLLNVYRLKQTG